MRKVQIKEMRDAMGAVDKSHASFSLFESVTPVKRRNTGKELDILVTVTYLRTCPLHLIQVKKKT